MNFRIKRTGSTHDSNHGNGTQPNKVFKKHRVNDDLLTLLLSMSPKKKNCRSLFLKSFIFFYLKTTVNSVKNFRSIILNIFYFQTPDWAVKMSPKKKNRPTPVNGSPFATSIVSSFSSLYSTPP